MQYPYESKVRLHEQHSLQNVQPLQFWDMPLPKRGAWVGKMWPLKLFKWIHWIYIDQKNGVQTSERAQFRTMFIYQSSIVKPSTSKINVWWSLDQTRITANIPGFQRQFCCYKYILAAPLKPLPFYDVKEGGMMPKVLVGTTFLGSNDSRTICCKHGEG